MFLVSHILPVKRRTFSPPRCWRGILALPTPGYPASTNRPSELPQLSHGSTIPGRHRAPRHPASIDVFALQHQFGIQLHEWRWFYNFVCDYFRAILSVVPWWERETEKNILRGLACSTDTAADLWSGGGQKDTAVLGSTDIRTPISITGNDLIQVHYSGGSGAGGTDSFDAVQNFVSEYKENKDVED